MSKSRGWIEKAIIEITNAIIILTLNIMKRALKKGDAIIKALSLMEVKKKLVTFPLYFEALYLE